MEKSELRLRDYLSVDLAKLMQMYREAEGLSYDEALVKAKEKLLSDRVGAHKSENSISKQINDSIALDEDIDNGEIYKITTGETTRSL